MTALPRRGMIGGMVAAAAFGIRPAGADDHGKGVVVDTYAVLRQSPAATEEMLVHFKTIGVTWVRLAFDWSIIQPHDANDYRLGDYDEKVRALRRSGMELLGLLAYCPGWASRSGTSSHVPPADPRTFATFTRAMVERYAPAGIRAWEIWNEPNIAKFWAPQPDVAAYTALLKAAYRAIRAVDSGAMVMTAGLSPASNSRDSLSPAHFLRGIYANGGGGAFEAVGAHPYSFPRCPNAPYASNSWQQMANTPISMRGVMLAHGDGDKKIWMTEFGAPTGGNHPGRVSEQKQAAVLTQAYELAASYSWAGPLFWYDYRDMCTNTKDSECFFGLLRADGSPKPAFERFAAAP